MKKLLQKIRMWWIDLKKTRNDFLDIFSPKNTVKITIRDLDGNIVQTIKGRNIVTGYLGSVGNLSNISGRDFMRRVIVNSSTSGSVSGRYIAKMKLGTGGDTENVGDSALDQAISDASATQNVTTVTFDSAANDVTFTSSWGSSDVTGQSISEVALYSDQDDFIARKTFSSFSKTNAFTFQIEWTLRF